MKILILSPHTDDAELGAGGTIVRFIEEKHHIMWVAFSAAGDSIPENLPKNSLKKEFISIVNELGITEYKIHNYKVRYLFKHRQKILEILVEIRKNYNPDLVLTASRHDKHQDHVIVTEEAIRAFKNNSSIIGYELPWNHLEFTNTLYMKLSKKHIEKKIDILKKYKSQILVDKKYFSKRFIFSLAIVRGLQCCSEFAESFEVIRWIM